MLKSDPEIERLAFTVLAIEASAQKMGISPSEMRKRLDKVGQSRVSFKIAMTLYIPRARKLWQVMWSKLLKIGKEKNNGKANIISWFKCHC